MASCGSNVAPIFLRLALGLTFLWAGWNKVFNHMEVQGERAAILANLDVIEPPAPGVTPAPNVLPVPDATSPVTPPTPIPETVAPEPAPAPPAPRVPDAAPEADPAEPPPARELAPTSAPASRPVELLNTEPNVQFVQVSMQLAPLTYTASDFPEPQQVRGLYGLVFTINNAAAPKSNDAGKTPMPLMPAAANQGRWPVYLAWTIALTELIGGVFFLVGFLGRLAGFMNAGVMAGALWLTQFGPAIQSGTAKLGFLPAYGKDGTLGLWATNSAGSFAYAMPLWQLMLLCACLAVMVLGSGSLSIDALFRRSHSPVTKDEA
jgi:uncharacterized membrane protein YphA (DoxX/SURF4 family)